MSHEHMVRYAEYARDYLMEQHFGLLPCDDGWVIYSNQGRSAKVDRFLSLLQETYSTSSPVWDDENVTAIVLMDGEDAGDLDYEEIADLWFEACGASENSDCAIPHE